MQLELVPPPASNTGLNSQGPSPLTFELQEKPANPDKSPSLSADSLTLLWDELEGFDILPLVKELLLVEFDFTKSRTQKIGVVWDYVFTGTYNCLFMYRRTPNGLRYRLCITGKACASVSLDLLLRFIECARSQNPEITCSRIDICLDDFSRRLTFDKLCNALESGQYSGFSSSHVVRNFDGSGGWTVYLGSRESQHFARIYNKEAESKGLIKSTRFESEFKGDKANSIFVALSQAPCLGSAIRLMRGYIFGNFNFIERKDKNLERCSMLDWWAEFVEYTGFERLRLLIEKPVPTVERRVKWIHKQVEKTMALLCRAFGRKRFAKFVNECVKSGSERLKRIDDLLIIEYLHSTATV